MRKKFSLHINLLNVLNSCYVRAVPWLKRLVAGLSPQRPGFAPGSIHVGFVVEKVALGSSSVSPANIIPPLLHIHLSSPHGVCDSSDQAAHYHHLGPKLGASFLTRHFGWKQNKKVSRDVKRHQCNKQGYFHKSFKVFLLKENLKT
jgi:hypothetical protein